MLKGKRHTRRQKTIDGIYRRQRPGAPPPGPWGRQNAGKEFYDKSANFCEHENSYSKRAGRRPGEALSVDAPSILAAAEMARERYEDDFAVGAAYSPAEMFELVSGALGAADLPEADEAAAGTPPESLNQ